MPSRDMLVRSVTPPGAMGKVFGFVSTGFSIGGIVSPLLFGYLLDHGQPSLVFQVVAAFMVVSLVTVFTAVGRPRERSEEHTSELQSLMRISYAVFCLNKKT